MNLFKRLKSDEKGTVIVLVAIGMAAFLGFTALVTDVGLLYLTRQKLVNSADAAVLAGAQELPNDSARARTEAERYLAFNELGDSHEIKVSADNIIIEASVSKDVQLFFASALGWVDSSRVNATSAAGVGALAGYKGIVPFGITKEEADKIVVYQDARLKVAEGDEETGVFGALALGGTGGKIFKDNTKYGYNEWVRMGDILPTQTGDMEGPTKEGVTYRYNNCEHGITCTVENPIKDCPKILMIPIFVPYEWDTNQMKEVKIVGFAAFYLSKAPQDGEIIGQFIRTVMPGEIGVGVINDYGVLGVKLVK